MKKLMFVAICSLMMIGCGQQQAEKDKELSALRDSLNQIISQKDNEIDGMMETFNDIEAGFREIDAAEGRVALARQGEGANAKERIRENMQFIKDAMVRNKELINKLRQQLRHPKFIAPQMVRIQMRRPFRRTVHDLPENAFIGVEGVFLFQEGNADVLEEEHLTAAV